MIETKKRRGTFLNHEIIVTSSSKLCLHACEIDGAAAGMKDERHYEMLRSYLVQEFMRATKVFPLSRTILIWLRLKLDNLCYTVCARTEDKATLRSDLSAGRVTEGRHDVVALFLSALPCPTR